MLPKRVLPICYQTDLGRGLTAGDQPVSILDDVVMQPKKRLMPLVEQLSWQLGHTVVDKTGLKGNYDFSLPWTPGGRAKPA